MSGDIVQELKDDQADYDADHYPGGVDHDGFRDDVWARAAAEIERLRAANAEWLAKWERQECSWCGTKQSLDVIADRSELLDALLDRPDPLSRAGVCIFCEQRVGLSVFSNELLNPGRHLKGCAWVSHQQKDRRALEADQ